MRYLPETLRQFVAAIFVELGAAEPRAHRVAEHLVEANLKGHDSHGIGMVPNYVHGIASGTLDVAADVRVDTDQGAVLGLDGQFGFGQVVGQQATALAIERALQTGIACVGLKNSYHLGRIGEYGEQCANAGLVSIHFVNVVGHPPFVSPWGGRDKRLQTNPFCCAVPTTDHPIVLDMATSAIALGKVRVASKKGEPVPEGALFDQQGNPTTNADALAEGGSLGPFGQHKGYGLAVICELLGGALAGQWTMSDLERQAGYTANNMLMFVLNPNLFGGADAFAREVANLADWLRSSRPAAGFDKVRLPGDPERESEVLRLQGIPVDDESFRSVCEAARKAGIGEAEIQLVEAQAFA